MVLLPLLALALIGVCAVALLVAGAKGASLSDFLDRPLCWLLGHPSPGSVMRYEENYRASTGLTLPAEVWLCNRCGHLVTLVGPKRKES